MLSGSGNKLAQGVRVQLVTLPLPKTTIPTFADEDEKTSSCPADSIDLSSLFDRAPLINYCLQVEKAQLHLKHQELDAAQEILLGLIQEYPAYPEAYVELGNLFSKLKDPARATLHYGTALEITPFDVATRIKCTIQFQNLCKILPQHTVSPGTLDKQFKEAKELKVIEQSFIQWYHNRLRYRFLELKINTELPLTQGPARLLNHQDVSLSNGAVLETLNGFRAWTHNKHHLAIYYFERAIIKFEHDCIAWSGRGFSQLATASNSVNLLSETSKIIDKYRYPIAYFLRFIQYIRSDNDDLAYQDLMNFMCRADQTEFVKLLAYREEIFSFISKHNQDETLPISDDVSDSIEIIEEVKKSVKRGVFKGDGTLIVKTIKNMLRRSPQSAECYYALGFFYEFSNNLVEANNHYSMAMWWGQPKDYTKFFYGRAKIYLRQRNLLAAEEDLDRALFFLNKVQGKDVQKAEMDTLNEFAYQCLRVGKEFEKAGNLDLTEEVFRLGIARRPVFTVTYEYAGQERMSEKDENAILVKLYLACVDVLEAQGKDNILIRDYIFIAIRDLDLGSHEGHKLLQKKMDLYAKKINRQQTINSTPKIHAIAAEEKSQPTVIKKINNQHNFFMQKKPQAKSRHTPIQVESYQDTVIDLITLNQEESQESKLEKKMLEEQRKAQKKLKNKNKKQALLLRRKSNHAAAISIAANDSCAITDSAKSEYANVAKDSLVEIKNIPLTDFEKKVFNLIAQMVPEEERSKYKTYLGGGWAYDKVRLKLLGKPVNTHNDKDYVTNIPRAYLEKSAKAIPEVSGLYTLMEDGIKIDIVFESDLSNLWRIAKCRDFLSLFIDDEGNIYDPSGFGISNLLRQQLYSSLPRTEIFKDDPLRIFRAIYTATKRELDLGSIRKQIHLDRCLLVPRLIDPETQLADRIFHPHRFNHWLAKLFSQQLALSNYALLKKFNLFENLFPDLHEEIKADFEWIDNQILISNNYLFPRVTIIYSTFIASCLDRRVSVIFKDNILQRTEPLLSAASKIYDNSLLFKDAFSGGIDELLSYLQRSLLDRKVWREERSIEIPSTESTVRRLGR